MMLAASTEHLYIKAQLHLLLLKARHALHQCNRLKDCATVRPQLHFVRVRVLMTLSDRLCHKPGQKATFGSATRHNHMHKPIAQQAVALTLGGRNLSSSGVRRPFINSAGGGLRDNATQDGSRHMGSISIVMRIETTNDVQSILTAT